MLMPNQTARKAIDARMTQRLEQRQRRHARRRIGIAATERQEAAAAEGEANRRRHRA